jgi:hypothetical protein
MAGELEDSGDLMTRARIVGQVLLVFGVALAPFWWVSGRSIGIVYAFLLAGGAIALLRR